MRHHRFEAAFVLLAATAVGFAADPPVNPTGPKAVPISIAISSLRKEAQDGWRANNDWPRKDLSFAAEKAWTVPSDAVIQALTRKLDSNAAIDGYIKWQLLSFTPELVKANSETVRRLSASAPKPLPTPTLNPEVLANPDTKQVGMSIGRQMAWVQNLKPIVGTGVVAYKPELGVISSGTGIGASPETGDPQQRRLFEARRINADLEDARQLTAVGNVPIHAFREVVAEAFSAERGVQLALLMKDVRDRVEAGDPTAGKAMQRLMEAAKKWGGDPSVTAQTRQQLLEWAPLLGQIRTPITESVEVDGQRFKPKGYTMAIEKKDVQLLTGYLQGN